ncbi:MAG: Gfo/Idh/MocA family oxidoreductase [Planctomycetes bacterium]|nr:Gfo/Idh/MocA family oxidoreductase [Planctomycetota bacterium]
MSQKSPEFLPELSRRSFVQSAALTSAGLWAGWQAWAQEKVESAPAGNEPELAVAIIGVGSQGYNSLLNCSLKIPGVRFVAVCDIWPFWQKRALKLLEKNGQKANGYTDYQEMLAKEKQLDAVIVATPDFKHAEHAIACLKAGKHVYCEKEMSNTLDGARQMVLAARETRKLLQIGHQRRSNPRYLHALKLMESDKILGRMTHCYGQWNRSRLLEGDWPKADELDADTLKRYGFESMHQHRNWRWYRKLSGGPMCDLGSHQVDIFGWFAKAKPGAVIAGGGTDYYKSEWYDNVMCIYEFPTPAGMVRASYQILNTTGHGGFYETFMGDEGSMTISEDSRIGEFFREPTAKKHDWEAESETTEKAGQQAFTLKIGETLDPSGKPAAEGQKLLEEVKKPVHQLHLENFFSAVRHGTPLSCPAELAYETCVTVMKVNDAVAAQKRLEFKPEEFVV